MLLWPLSRYRVLVLYTIGSASSWGWWNRVVLLWIWVPLSIRLLILLVRLLRSWRPLWMMRRVCRNWSRWTVRVLINCIARLNVGLSSIAWRAIRLLRWLRDCIFRNHWSVELLSFNGSIRSRAMQIAPSNDRLAMLAKTSTVSLLLYDLRWKLSAWLRTVLCPVFWRPAIVACRRSRLSHLRDLLLARRLMVGLLIGDHWRCCSVAWCLII